jgi:dinuclear metal center YbgI/SA1388 family protein
MTTNELARWLDAFLRVKDIADDSLNGLQVENRGSATRVALAVDASEQAIRTAAQSGADFLIVHHGLFWGKPEPLIGPLLRRIRALIESDIALYAAHLPLDCHPMVGNNVQLAERMGWKDTVEFGEYHGTVIGRSAALAEPIPLADLVNTLRRITTEEPRVWNFGPGSARRVAVVSGGAMSMIDQVLAGGFDTFITGEGGHSHYWYAREAGINVVCGGHYATETLGVQALGGAVKREFALETVFLDQPTGL